MDRVFEPGEINGMVVENRFVRSATWEAVSYTHLTLPTN